MFCVFGQFANDKFIGWFCGVLPTLVGFKLSFCYSSDFEHKGISHKLWYRFKSAVSICL